MRNRVLLVAACVLILISLYLVLIYVPTDRDMGIVQRIFYFHVPVAWNAFLAFFITFIASIRYLGTRARKWDQLASSSAEIGLLFTTLVLITGSIWARPAWGVWWVWDARLTTALVLWLIYVAYFLVRSYIAEEERKARFAAVVGVVGFIDVPIVFLAIQLSRTQHPPALIFQGGLAPQMLLTLMVCIVSFTVVYLVLLPQRLAIRKSEDEMEELKGMVRR